MSDFPTIFELLEWLGFLRGYPAAYLVFGAATAVLVLGDWRFSLLALIAHYLFTSLLVVDVLDPRLAIVKLFSGAFIGLILYFTARQVNWGRLPVDVIAEEAEQIRPERQIRLGPLAIGASLPLRSGLTAAVALLILNFGGREGYRLPVVPEHVSLAIYALMGLGLLGLSLTAEPLRAGMGLLMFLSGFELFYSALEQSVAMLAFLSAAELAVTIVLAYLVQARHAYPALLD